MATDPVVSEPEFSEPVVPISEVIPPEFTIPYTLTNELREDAAPRHIFIFFDGTWNEDRTLTGLSSPTNVLRMYQKLNHETDNPGLQPNVSHVIARYYRGVGNRQDNDAARRRWFAFSGMDEERIRSTALANLYLDYKSKKDSIYIIGFSRGAASARLLAREICLKGLPPKLKVTTTYFGNLLTKQIEPRISRVERIGQDNEAHKVKVAFLGCWDTVDALVLPNRYPRHKWMDKLVRWCKSIIPRLTGKEGFRGDENKIPLEVDKAVHCVALDETRHEFLPSLMPYAPNVEEVWFPGVHSDVGGGYKDNMLADAPYKFMKSRLIASVKAHGGNMETLFKGEAERNVATKYCFHFYGLNGGVESVKRTKELLGFGRSIRRIRVLDAPSHVKPKIHSSLKLIRNSDSVFAADDNDKLTWMITYEPYNVRELRDNNRGNNVQKPEDHFEYAYDDEKASLQSSNNAAKPNGPML